MSAAPHACASTTGLTWIVRRGGDVDLAACAELETASFPTPWTLAMLRAALDREALLLVCCGPPGSSGSSTTPDGSPLGYALLTMTPPEAELLRLAVRPEARTHGVASSLLARIRCALRTDRVTSLYLEVRSDNVAAIGLYDKWRFERVAVRRGYYADGVDAVVLRWRLDELEPDRR
ncbi:MAG TPA: GNAT family N-acetyltransferase [Thermoanaerobaculia bacterium]|nr:GNAT family N-acetyltransferase [Thermoanaerobaculia bacterium]